MTDRTLRDHQRRAVPPKEQAAALNAESRTWDPVWVVCPGDEFGVCRGDKWPAMHLRDGTQVYGDCPACKGTGRVPFSREDRLALTAYCGHETARVLVGHVKPRYSGLGRRAWKKPLKFWPLDVWLSGLASRWPGVIVRAALAAARVAYAEWLRARYKRRQAVLCIQPQGDSLAPGRALEACEAWIACPCEEHREAWRALSHDLPPWVPHEQWKENIDAQTLRPAAQVATPEAVREAIQKALIAWALNE
jgi:hypothetical protein